MSEFFAWFVGESDTDCPVSVQVSVILFKRVRLLLLSARLVDTSLQLFSLACANITIFNRISTLFIVFRILLHNVIERNERKRAKY